MNLVLDTNVLIAAFIGKGFCHTLLEHCLRIHFSITSEFILDEVGKIILDDGKYQMTDAQTPRKPLKKRLSSKPRLSQEEIDRRQAELRTFRARCQPIFERLKSELIKTHYNWYMAVEPDSGDYFIHQDEVEVAKICRQKHPNAIPFVFRINETGVCGTI